LLHRLLGERQRLEDLSLLGVTTGQPDKPFEVLMLATKRLFFQGITLRSRQAIREQGSVGGR
ncbi:MAG: hypothetical protein ACKO3P_08170, partial [Planctomycetaceae bacterium]